MENKMARYDDDYRDEISTGDWIISLILSYIPIIGFIMLLIWAFSSNTPPSKANWAKAQLIIAVALIGLVFALSFLGILGANSMRH